MGAEEPKAPAGVWPERLALTGMLGERQVQGTERESSLNCLFGTKRIDLKEDNKVLTVRTIHKNGKTCERGTQTSGI